MRHLKTALTVIGAVTILLLAGNTIALAATGQALLLGKSNSANNITALTRTTQGTVLKLQSAKAFNAPLAVNGTGKVANLNADKVDGLDSSALRTSSYVYGVATATTDSLDVVIPVPNGTYLITYSHFFNNLAGADAVQCYLSQGNNTLTGYAAVNNTGNTYDPSLSGSGILTKSSTEPLRLHCDAAGGTFSVPAGLPTQITATRTTTIGGGTILPGFSKVQARGAQEPTK